MDKSQLPSFEEEKEVVERAQSGDRQAAAQLYHWFGDALYRRVILPRLPVIEQAEDVLRDTFRIAFERIQQFKAIDRSIFFWLRRIAINLVIDTYRRQVRKHKLAERLLAEDALESITSSPEPAPDQSMIADDTRALIEAALKLINPRYALALRLRLLEDRSRSECAEALNITPATFDVLFHRACKAFRGKYPP